MTEAQKTRALALAKAALKVAPTLLRDLAGFGGVAMIVHGVGLYSVPAGWICAGVLFVAGALPIGRLLAGSKAA